MNYKVVIIHGTEASPKHNWFPWLAQRLEADGCEVIMPQFPTPEGQNLDAWLAVLDQEIGAIDSQTVLVGHSSGPAFILNALERSTAPARAAFLVAGFIGPLNNPHFDPLNESLACREFDWEKIRGRCERFYLYHGSNDPYVPVSKGYHLAQQLKAPLQVVDGGGHLNAEAGFDAFPKLLRDICDELGVGSSDISAAETSAL